MREGWTETTIGDVLRLEYGRPLPESERSGSGYPVFGSAGIVGRNSEAITPPGPAIVVGRKGTAGAVHWSDGPCWPIDTTFFVRITGDVIPHFVLLMLQAADLPSITAQTGVPGLNRDRAYGVRCFIPPLAEQRRIVDLIGVLDDVTRRAIVLTEAAAATANAVVESSVSRNRWDVVRLRDLAVPGGLIGGPFGSDLRTRDYTTSGVPVINGANHSSLDVRLRGPFQFVSEAKAHQLRRNSAAPGDVVATNQGTVGQVSLVGDGPYPRYVVSQRQLRLRLDPAHSLAGFVVAVLRGNDLQAELASQTIRTGVSHINLRIFGDLLIPLPPLARQREIAAAHDAAIHTATSAATFTERARALRYALLDDLLAGRRPIADSYDRFLDGAA